MSPEARAKARLKGVIRGEAKGPPGRCIPHEVRLQGTPSDWVVRSRRRDIRPERRRREPGRGGSLHVRGEVVRRRWWRDVVRWRWGVIVVG